jgi:hypothetical protein
VCGHYHKFEDGEVCGICGHRLQEATEKGPQQSAFSTEILPQFLYLGSYDNASRAELLKAQNITRILNVSGRRSFFPIAVRLDFMRALVQRNWLSLWFTFRLRMSVTRSGSLMNLELELET